MRKRTPETTTTTEVFDTPINVHTYSREFESFTMEPTKPFSVTPGAIVEFKVTSITRQVVERV